MDENNENSNDVLTTLILNVYYFDPNSCVDKRPSNNFALWGAYYYAFWSE